MARDDFRLDRKGVGEILKTQFTQQVSDLAEAIADNVRDIVDPGVDVEVEVFTTDRAEGSVAIADPDGLALQATDGALTRAAAAVGLEVRTV